MAKPKPAKDISTAIAASTDSAGFINHLLVDVLGWPVPPNSAIEDITYDYSPEEVGAAKLNPNVVAGKIRQIVLPGCPWGIFLLEFKHPDVFTTGRGLTGPLRVLLRGLVSRGRKDPSLPSFQREHLLFICTHNYQHFRFAQFRAPLNDFRLPQLASFGWGPGDSTKTVSTYNLPHLAFLDPSSTVDNWIAEWTKAFDVERVTKKFYEDYKLLHALFKDAAKNVPTPNDRPWLASVTLNRLMFVYFLQRKGFLDNGNEHYLEQKLAASKKLGKNRFYDSFLALLFFEGFAKPETKRSAAAKAALGDIRYLNGGLFLEHPIEQAAEKAGKPIDWPDSVFDSALAFFASFSWNLNDIPGGEDNEINPDVLGYILEKYVNQKAFGAYYTRPEITNYLCERTIHRLILDGINTKGPGVPGLPFRNFDSVQQLLKKLDDKLASRLLDDVLPGLSLLDPACGSGAFLVAAMKTLINIYAAIYSWIEFHGSKHLKEQLAAIRKNHASLDYFIKWRIITDNLYGVDIMPEAVEIARLRLFLSLAASVEKAEQLEPLPNIDFNIMAGNSLIGLLNVKPAAFDQGKLFGQSYDQIVADRDRQLQNYRHTAAYADDLTALRDNITEINNKAQEKLNELLLDQFEELGIQFEQATWDTSRDVAGKTKNRALNPKDMAEMHPFHWAFSFHEVMKHGGFDGIITNPPWETFKPNGKEFFQLYSETITKKSMMIQDFEEEQGELLKDKDIRKDWLQYLSTYPHQSALFRAADDYTRQTAIVNGKKTGSDLNLYKLFVERCFRLLRTGGQCGIVIPSGIYTDLGAKGLRELLFTEATLDALFCLENTKGVFEGVHRSFKIVVLSFERGGKTDSFPAEFMRHDVSELEDFPSSNSLLIETSLIRLLSPDALSIMEFKSATDIATSNKLFRFPRLCEVIEGQWNLKFSGEFHMTNDSHLFERNETRTALPMYEGKFIHQFDNLWDVRLRYFIDENAGRKDLCGSEVDSGQSLSYQCYRFGFRKIGRNTDSRTLIGTILPRNVFHGENIQSVMVGSQCPNSPTTLEQLYICGVMNSFVVDWQVRFSVSANVNMFFVYQLPVPRLTTADPGFAEIVERSAKLICTTPEFDDLAKEAGLTPPDHTAGVTDPAARAKLRAELDGIVAHLYGLTESQFEHILATFPLVDPQVRADALAAYQKLITTGEAARYNPDLPKPQARSAPMVPDADAEVLKLIAAGESANLEFKSTARFNIKANQPDPKMERIIAKTVAAFLNSKGGTLLIGVADDKTIHGLADDFVICKKPDRDAFELWLMQMLLNDFEKDAAAQLTVTFHALGPADTADQRPALVMSAASPPPPPRAPASSKKTAMKSSTSAPATPPTPSPSKKFSPTSTTTGRPSAATRSHLRSHPQKKPDGFVGQYRRRSRSPLTRRPQPPSRPLKRSTMKRILEILDRIQQGFTQAGYCRADDGHTYVTKSRRRAGANALINEWIAGKIGLASTCPSRPSNNSISIPQWPGICCMRTPPHSPNPPPSAHGS